MGTSLDALVTENRELRRALNHQRERIRAFEQSRWWRLHPRRLLGGAELDGGQTAARADISTPARASGDECVPAAADEMFARFHTEVVAHGSFEHDWVTSRLSSWRQILSELDGRPAEILEIGSFEGLSACYFLWRLPLATVTCVDTFAGGPEYAGMAVDGLEAAFDSNVALVDAQRVTKLVGDSKRRLLDLVDESTEFDLVYVDGSHLGLDVLVDAALAWNLLKSNGVIVFDDYRWADIGDDPLLRPGVAIDAFRELVSAKHEVVFANDQIALRRLN